MELLARCSLPIPEFLKFAQFVNRTANLLVPHANTWASRFGLRGAIVIRTGEITEFDPTVEVDLQQKRQDK